MVHQEFLGNYCFCFLLCIKIPKPVPCCFVVVVLVFVFKKEEKKPVCCISETLMLRCCFHGYAIELDDCCMHIFHIDGEKNRVSVKIKSK